jgi:iron(III) transport system permease protein
VSWASWWTLVRRISFPLVLPQIVSGWLWVIAHSARDLTFPIVLMTSDNVVIASATKLYWDQPDLTRACALAITMVAILMTIVIPIELWTTRAKRFI